MFGRLGTKVSEYASAAKASVVDNAKDAKAKFIEGKKHVMAEKLASLEIVGTAFMTLAALYMSRNYKYVAPAVVAGAYIGAVAIGTEDGSKSEKVTKRLFEPMLYTAVTFMGIRAISMIGKAALTQPKTFAQVILNVAPAVLLYKNS